MTDKTGNKLNILIAVDAARYGGAEIAALRIANGLSKRSNVTVFILHETLIIKEVVDILNPEIEVIYYLKEKKIKDFISWKINRLLSIFNQQNRQKNKRKWMTVLLDNSEFDIINSHSMFTDIFFAEVKTKVPLVSTLHGHYEDLYKINPAVVENAFKLIQNIITHFIYLNKNAPLLIRKFISNPDISFHQIYNGFIPPPFKKHQDKNLFVFGMVSRGIADKGWKQLISAFELINKKYSFTRLMLVGGGDYVKKLLQDFNISKEVIEVVDHTKNPLDYIARMNVSVLPTHIPFESLPNFIVESIFAGVPVISTPIGEIKEMLGIGTRDVCGQVVNINHENIADPEELKTAMEKYITDKEMYALHSDNTIKMQKLFNMNNCVERYMSVFNSALKNE